MAGGMKPISYAQHRLGFGKLKLLEIVASDPTFPAMKIGAAGHWRVDPEALEEWITAQRNKRFEIFRGSLAGKGGVHLAPEYLQTEEAANNLRQIAFTGVEPDNHWRNASLLRSKIPSDLVAAFDVDETSSWSIAVAKAEKLLGLPDAARKLALEHVSKRLQAFNEAMDDVTSVETSADVMVKGAARKAVR